MTEGLGDAPRSFAREALRAKADGLHADQRVRIQRGPLRGSEGTILACAEAGRLLIVVDGLQQGAYLKVDKSFVEPA